MLKLNNAKYPIEIEAEQFISIDFSSDSPIHDEVYLTKEQFEDVLRMKGWC